jgi:hypothetical protein
MPVILRPEDEEQWLDASRTPFVKAKSLLKTLSRRDDGRSRRFTNHQLGKVRRPGVHSACFRWRDTTRAVVAVVTTTKLYHFYLYPLSTVVDTVENDARDCMKQASYDKSPQLPLL